MNRWAWDELTRITGGRWHIEPESPSIDFAGVCIDTREMQAGQVFFAFVGEQTDGHGYLEQAQSKGAAACVVTESQRVPKDLSLPTLIVDDPQQALTDLARAWRARLRAKVIAITGSNGKTTTCRLMHGVCTSAGRAFVSPKSFNNALGVPITILNTPFDADYLVAEVGMSTPGEIAARTELLRPDTSIITSIGRAHLEALGSIDKIAHEKSQIICNAPEHSIGIVPAGNEPLNRALDGDTHRIERMGDDFEVIGVDDIGSRFTIDGVEFSVPIAGAHNASNAGLCVLAARALGIDDSVTGVGLASSKPPAMRFERVVIETAGNPIVIINDAYNANPDSMRAALATFANLNTDGPKVVVLGEMLEMGDSGPSEHDSLAQHVSGMDAFDRVVLLGAGFEHTDAVGLGVAMFPDSSDARIMEVARTITAGETVLIKGSRGVKLERLIAILGDMHASSRSQTHGDSPTHA